MLGAKYLPQCYQSHCVVHLRILPFPEIQCVLQAPWYTSRVRTDISNNNDKRCARWCIYLYITRSIFPLGLVHSVPLSRTRITFQTKQVQQVFDKSEIVLLIKLLLHFLLGA